MVTSISLHVTVEHSSGLDGKMLAAWAAGEAAMQTFGGFAFAREARHRAQMAQVAALSDRANLDEHGTWRKWCSTRWGCRGRN